MLACPRCACRLHVVRYGSAAAYRCARCGGHAITYPVIRDAMDKGRWQRLWRRVLADAAGTGVRCPGCGRGTAEIREGGLVIDSCRTCHLIWFDRGEIPVPVHELGRRRAAAETPRRAAAAIGADVPESRAPESGWHLICGWLGLPFEVDSPHVRRAYVTVGLAVAFLAVHVLATAVGLPGVIGEWGFIPDQMGRHAGATWITSFFLHAGLLHLFSNAYFLIAFGDNVEEDLGAARYLVLVFLGAVAGCLLHAAIDPRGDIPLVGASAGISAVLFYYAFRFPSAQIGWAWRLFLIPMWWFRMTAKTAFVLWLVLQLVLAYFQVKGQTNVSALGHLGGVLAGVLFVVSQRAAAAGERHGAP
ncbi:MAG: rhomboid family intramembrane serine protease [Planctomycetota bacterium]